MIDKLYLSRVTIIGRAVLTMKRAREREREILIERIGAGEIEREMSR